MSKVDAQRAMRDARYAAYQARKDAPGEAATPRPVSAEGSQNSGASDAPCGHRSIGNKSCTRPAGHPEKSHRYS